MRVLMTVRYSLGYYIKLGWIFAVFEKKNTFLKLGTEAIIGLWGWLNISGKVESYSVISRTPSQHDCIDIK